MSESLTTVSTTPVDEKKYGIPYWAVERRARLYVLKGTSAEWTCYEAENPSNLRQDVTQWLLHDTTDEFDENASLWNYGCRTINLSELQRRAYARQSIEDVLERISGSLETAAAEAESGAEISKSPEYVQPQAQEEEDLMAIPPNWEKIVDHWVDHPGDADIPGWLLAITGEVSPHVQGLIKQLEEIGTPVNPNDHDDIETLRREAMVSTRPPTPLPSM